MSLLKKSIVITCMMVLEALLYLCIQGPEGYVKGDKDQAKDKPQRRSTRWAAEWTVQLRILFLSSFRKCRILFYFLKQ